METMANERSGVVMDDMGVCTANILGEGHTESLYAAESLANHLFRNGLASDAASLGTPASSTS